MDFNWDDASENENVNNFNGFDFDDGNESYSSEIFYDDADIFKTSNFSSAGSQPLEHTGGLGMFNGFSSGSASVETAPAPGFGAQKNHNTNFFTQPNYANTLTDINKKRFGNHFYGCGRNKGKFSQCMVPQYAQPQNVNLQIVQNQQQMAMSPQPQVLPPSPQSPNQNIMQTQMQLQMQNSNSNSPLNSNGLPFNNNVQMNYNMNIGMNPYSMNSFANGVNTAAIAAAAATPFFGKIELAAMDQFKPKTNHGKIAQWNSSTPLAARTDQLFNDICLNTAATLNPVKLGFIPSHFWPNKDYSFADIVFDFFQRKNNTNCRFLHKLYNALKISQISSTYSELTGVQWITPNVIKVSKGQFARLLGIKSIDGSLFHQQGNFPAHGFIELNREQAKTFCPMADISTVDFDEVRLLIHQSGLFVSSSTEPQVRACSSLVAQRKR